MMGSLDFFLPLSLATAAGNWQGKEIADLRAM
jgi:hypothetical protein